MEIIEALILGVIQGLTEFLPVSSSGHLVLGQRLMGINTGNTTFEVMVHAATVLATITVFWGEIVSLVKGGVSGLAHRKMNQESSYMLKIVVSMLPILVIGLFFKDYVESLFSGTVRFVGFMLLITSALLTLSHFVGLWASKRGRTGHPITYKDALVVGLAQAVAVVPGISRSGSTISTGLILGVDKGQMAKFSFLMVLVPILGEAFLEILGGAVKLDEAGLPLLVGFVAAYVSGLFACRVMVRIVSRGKLYWFAIYCALAGVVAIIIN